MTASEAKADLAVSKHYFRFWTQSGHRLVPARTVSSANASNFRSDNEISSSNFNVDQKANMSE
jgi:hypothetical protein